MNIRLMIAAFSLFVTSQPPSLMANNSEWIRMANPGEVRDLLSGKSFGNEQFADYYRSDGAMAFYHKMYKTVVVRKWVVEDDGRVCTYIYVKPDKLVECNTFARSATDPKLYGLFLDNVTLQKITVYDEPMQLLVDEVNAKAGPEN